MNIGQPSIQKGVNAQLRFNPGEPLKEGQVFSGKTIKSLPGQMMEIAAFGQRITAKLEVPLQMGERYFFEVASLKNELQLKVVSGSQPNNAVQRFSDQAAFLLDKLQLPVNKETAAFTALALEAGKVISKETIQSAASWLTKVELKDGIDAFRFMMNRGLPITETIFHALVSARSAESLTEKLTFLQQQLLQTGNTSKAADMISKLMGDLPEGGKQVSWPEQNQNTKIVQAVQALFQGEPSTNSTAVRLTQQLLQLPALNELTEQIPAFLKNMKTANNTAGSAPPMPEIQMAKKALVQLSSRPVSLEAIHAFKEAVSLSVPAQHPDRSELLQKTAQATDQLIKGLPAGNKQLAALFQVALSAAASVPEQAFPRLSALLGTDAGLFKEPSSEKEAAAALRNAFRFLGVDHEAGIQSKNNIEPAQQSVKQELLKLMSETVPVPIRDAAEQLIGKVNAQHILSAESGPVQQLVMQMPVHFAEFQGDVTIKWQGKKKEDGKIDADFCRVLFYVTMQNLNNTVIDMQVQNRIIHINIIADTDPARLKSVSLPAMVPLKKTLEQQGYRLSGVQFKQPEDKEESLKAPLARIMDEERYTEVDLRI